MTRYLLDTNILSHLIRNPHGPVAQRIRRVGEARVVTSIIVAAELRFGAAKKQAPRLAAEVEAILSVVRVLPFETPADVTYAGLRARLETVGRPVGANDMLIASQAITGGYTLVTANVAEFSRIEGLRCENWIS